MLRHYFNKKLQKLTGEYIYPDQRITDFFYIKYFIAFNKQRKIKLHGGIGDALLLIPFIIEAAKSKKCICHVDHSDQVVGNPKDYSYFNARVFLHGNNIINPLKELIENIPNVEVKLGKIKNQRMEYWHPYYLSKFNGGYKTPNDYPEYFKVIFNDEDVNQASEIVRKYNLNQKKLIIGLHLRRNSEQIVELAAQIKQKFNKTDLLFVLFGSSLHDPIPSLIPDNSISFIDSYDKGITLRPLLLILSYCDLFIGGRGGFELYSWLSRTPSINIFDEKSFDELKYFWPNSLWEQNIFPFYVDGRTLIKKKPDIMYNWIFPFLEKKILQNQDRKVRIPCE